MNAIMRTIFSLRYNYPSPVDQIRARGVIVATVLISAFIAVYIGSLLLNIAFGGTLSTTAAFVGFTLPLGGGIYWLVQSGRLRIASFILVGILTFLGGVSTLNGIEDVNSGVIVVAIIMASMLFGSVGAIISTFISIGLILVGAAFPILPQPSSTPEVHLTYFMALVLITTISMLIFGTAFQQMATRFSTILKRAANVNDIIAHFNMEDDEQTLLQTAIAHIEDDLGFEVAQIYLMEDDGEIMRYVTRTMSEQQRGAIPYKQATSVLYLAAEERQIEVISIYDAPERRRQLLSGMQSALNVPLYSGNRLIGVLDIQTYAVNAFDVNTIGVFQLIGKQLATMIQNMRTIQALKADLMEEERMVFQQRSQLDALKNRSQHQLPFMPLRETGSKDSILGFDLKEGMLHTTPATDITEDMRAALDRNELYIEDNPQTREQIITAPIRLRDQTIGALTFRLPEGVQLSTAQRDLLEGVIDRLALAIENRQLFDQSESLARREVKANEVGQVLLSTTDIETVLSLAAENFNSALGAVQTRIRIQPQNSQKTLKNTPSRQMDHAEEQA